MNHICMECGKVRDCGCGDCGESRLETCTVCQNLKMIPFAEHYNIPLSQLGRNPLGSYFIITDEQKKLYEEWSKK